jgi:hypothetical protein
MALEVVVQIDQFKYDVSVFLAERETAKKPLTYEEFLDATTEMKLFLVEFADAAGNQEIVWARRLPQRSSREELCVRDARVYDNVDLPNDVRNSAIRTIPLNSLIAIRLMPKRYNWRCETRLFEQE